MLAVLLVLLAACRPDQTVKLKSHTPAGSAGISEQLNRGKATNSLRAFFLAATAAAKLSRVESLGLRGRPGSTH